MSAIPNFNASVGSLLFKGELTIYEASAAFENLCLAFATGELRSVDLAGVTELDTAGLQILLMALRLQAPDNEPVSLINQSEAVRQVFELVALESRP